jgi:hypothetical protein
MRRPNHVARAAAFQRDARLARWILALVLLVLFVTDVLVTHAVFTSRFPGANDFYSRWGGARSWWTQGLSPYSEATSIQIEIGIYGRRALPGEDPGLFAYPFYTVFVLAPLAFLPYAWAEAAWLTLLEFALIGGVVGTIRLVEWRLPPVPLGATLVWAIFFYHSVRAILLGQFAVVIFALIVAVLWALRARRDVPAGVLLAFSTIKPQMVFMLVPLVIGWAVARRRWYVVIAFAIAMVVLCGASWLAVPGWLGDFVTQMTRYPSYTAIGSPVWIITRYFFPALGAPGEIVLSAVLLVWALATWLPLWRDESWPLFLWVAEVTLVVTNLIALRTATTNYVVLFIPLLHVLARMQHRWKRAGTWAVMGVEMTLLVGLWALFLATVVNKFEHPIMYLPLPVGLAVVLAIWRKEWVKTV